MGSVNLEIRSLQADAPVEQPAVRRAFSELVGEAWARLWGGKPPDLVLALVGLSIGLLMMWPITYVVWHALSAGADRWVRLLDTRIPALLWNTAFITLTTSLGSVVLGVSLAWLVYRCDTPGRRVWRWLLALPLMIPSYVGAVAYIMVFGPRGWIQLVLGEAPFNLYSYWGVLFVLTMFKFPYVFLIVGAALKRLNRSFEETARSLGLNPWAVFWRVTFPLLRPAIGAGAILTALCTLSEFGVVALLRYNTFTSAIYYQMESYDRTAATVLSSILIALTLVVLAIQRLSRRRGRFHQTTNNYRYPDTVKLGRWRPVALLWVISVLVAAVFLPLAVLAYWSVQGVARGALDARFWMFAWNSIQVAGLAALGAVALALPVIYLKARYPSLPATLIDRMSSSGYALPGVIVALGIIFVFNTYIPWLYNTAFLIVVAYVVRFLPQAMQYGDASLSQVSPRIDEAARSLGYAPWKVLGKVIVPLVAPGLLAGGALVFVSAIKELPATLILRPPGFDTLAVRVWVESSEAVYHMAAPAALLIVLVSVIPLKWMLSRY
jgi:iron(III) transport system permease protein